MRGSRRLLFGWGPTDIEGGRGGLWSFVKHCVFLERAFFCRAFCGHRCAGGGSHMYDL